MQKKKRKSEITNIVKSKGSFNETNQDYLDNNLFYNSILDLVNNSSDSDYEECKKKIEQQKNEKLEENENNEDKNGDIYDNLPNKTIKDKNDNNSNLIEKGMLGNSNIKYNLKDKF